MLFDLPSLIQVQIHLAWVEEQFTITEIDNVIKMLHNNKSPGPDGFSNEFIKNHKVAHTLIDITRLA